MISSCGYSPKSKQKAFRLSEMFSFWISAVLCPHECTFGTGGRLSDSAAEFALQLELDDAIVG
jgi:hypothetical protein